MRLALLFSRDFPASSCQWLIGFKSARANSMEVEKVVRGSVEQKGNGMTNDEIRMTKECPNDEIRKSNLRSRQFWNASGREEL
jgi:hypothetical protein